MAQTRREALNDTRWLSAKNVGADDIPGFGLCKVTGIDTDGHTFKVTLPDADSDTCLYFCCPTGIKKDKLGAISKDFPGWVLYNETPTAGQIFGSIAGDARLRSASSGFVVFGIVDARRKIARAGCACL